MDQKEWEKISQIFTQVVDLPSDERSSRIKSLCENDPELEKEVHILLDSHDNSEDFLENHRRNKNVLFDELNNTEQQEDYFTGEKIGRWTLVELLGRGGMGSVYKAEYTDETGLRQTGALKIIHKSLVVPSHLERFRLEQNILARLRHPNVAVFIDSGITDDGIPYMVMEYVEGEPIIDYCNKHCLSIDERLELFKTVCRAIQYAHKNLVVHRDLKSDNILVTEEGHLKILDFGIAKLLDPSNFEMADVQTQPGTRIMSIDYAAPEQISGNAITTSTDIYSLGILLFKLLTDISPFDFEDQSFKAAERIILEKDPPTPRQILTRCSDPDQLQQIAEFRASRPVDLRKKLKGDLDAITIKALRKEPEERYESAEAFENDLDRHQKGLPINARPDSVSYRAKKFIKRHRSGVITTSVMTLVFTGFLILYTVRVTTERNRAEEQRAHAEAAFTFLTDMLKAADPDQTGGEDVTARELLEEGTRRAMRELQEDPVLRSTVLYTIGDVYESIGDDDQADSLLSEALRLRREQFGPNHPETGQVLLALGRVHHGQAHFAMADSLYQLAEQTFASDEYAVQRAKVIRQRALSASQRGDDQTADSLFQQTLELRRKVLPPDHPDWAESLTDLSFDHIVADEFSAADSLLREVLEIRRRYDGNVHSQVARTLNNLAFVAERRSDYSSADAYYEEATQIYRQLYDDAHPSIATTLLNRGSLLRKQNHIDESEKILREALDQQRMLFGEMHPETASTMFLLGTVLRDQNRIEEAEALYKTALEARRATLGEDHWLVAASLYHLGSLYFDDERHELAETVYRESLEKRIAYYGSNHEAVANNLYSLGRTLTAQAHFPEAEKRFREALSIWQNTLDEGDTKIAKAFHRLADLLRRDNRLQEACPFYREALPIYEQTYGMESEWTIAVRQALTEC